MAKVAENAFLDGALNILKTTCTRMTVTSGQPAGSPSTVAQIDAVKLADVVMANGDFTLADGDTSGRKVSMTAKSGVAIDASGTATHVCLDNGTNQLYVTTCTSQALTSGNTVNIPLWKIEIADPT
jgi:hypothetical protein